MLKLFRCLACLSFREGSRVRFFIPHSLFFISCFLFSCSVSKQISKKADIILLKDSSIKTGHIGIIIFEPATGKDWYNYNAEKYFVPASNTKLFSLYAGMKYLGDSIPGLRYSIENQDLFIQPTGDPTFLHPDFKIQKVFEFLKSTDKKIYLNTSLWESESLGRGWSWDDYNADYMPERSSMPIYGNVIRFNNTYQALKVIPGFFANKMVLDSTQNWNKYPSKIIRKRTENKLAIFGISEIDNRNIIPFFTDNGEIIYSLLSDTLKKQIGKDRWINNRKIDGAVIHSQPSDSFFTIMMHRSDNFFAEQTLLMASNEKLGYMSDQKMIDYLLKNDLKDIPQKPRWVDGSGLSRYNLFSPRDFIYILMKLKNEFGFERLKVILPTGGTGTLSSLYKKDSGYIFAKTGTLSNHVALSGFLITKKNKFLLFSVLAGNFITGANPIRKAIEKFLSDIRQRY